MCVFLTSVTVINVRDAKKGGREISILKGGLVDEYESVLFIHTALTRYQFFSTITFLATGTFQREIADRSGISQPSLRCAQGIKWKCKVKRGFCDTTEMPNTIGARDCTHVHMKAPSANTTVQVIWDSDCQILSVVTCWPGGAHNSFISNNSTVGMCIEAGAVRNGWLVTVDMRYAATTSMPKDLLYSPDKVCKIVLACCVLHIIAVRHDIPPPPGTAIQARQVLLQSV
uniref:DDE Tnp4 domain-containing protein n=1 Tax=Amphilophus citrinellus TaxID=61819 RepID=A0A3Q0QQH5_AMPCI